LKYFRKQAAAAAAAAVVCRNHNTDGKNLVKNGSI
jgi:hypothetical protein